MLRSKCDTAGLPFYTCVLDSALWSVRRGRWDVFEDLTHSLLLGAYS